MLFAILFAAAALGADETNVSGRARAFLDRGEAAEARKLLEPALASEPKNAELHYLLAKSYMIEAQKSSNAVNLLYAGWTIGDELQAAIRLDPSRLDARLDLVRYYVLTPRVVGGSAKKARAEAAEIRKRDAALGAFAAGYIDYREKQFGIARKQLREAVTLAKDGATKVLALTWLGYLSQESRQYDDAFAAFDGILAIDPSHTAALYEIGRTAVFCHCSAERGEAALRRYLATTPKFGEPTLDEARAQLKLLR